MWAPAFTDLYIDVLGVVPPDWRGLHVDGVGTGLLEEVFGALGERGGGVGGSNESEGAA